MAKHTITVYRARLERTTVEVEAGSEYDAHEASFDAIRDKPVEWEMLPPEAQFYLTDEISYDNEPFILLNDIRPRVFDDEEGTSVVV